jgi:hypothetical protein
LTEVCADNESEPAASANRATEDFKNPPTSGNGRRHQMAATPYWDEWQRKLATTHRLIVYDL